MEKYPELVSATTQLKLTAVRCSWKVLKLDEVLANAVKVAVDSPKAGNKNKKKAPHKKWDAILPQKNVRPILLRRVMPRGRGLLHNSNYITVIVRITFRVQR